MQITYVCKIRAEVVVFLIPNIIVIFVCFWFPNFTRTSHWEIALYLSFIDTIKFCTFIFNVFVMNLIIAECAREKRRPTMKSIDVSVSKPTKRLLKYWKVYLEHFQNNCMLELKCIPMWVIVHWNRMNENCERYELVNWINWNE